MVNWIKKNTEGIPTDQGDNCPGCEHLKVLHPTKDTLDKNGVQHKTCSSVGCGCMWTNPKES